VIGRSLAAGATLAVLNVKGGFTVINWPTAFVIAVAMICGAVLINKPSDAAFGGDGGDGVTMLDAECNLLFGCSFIHAHNGQLRRCEMKFPYVKGAVEEVKCTDWLPVVKR
jgi:hypothetical protein